MSIKLDTTDHRRPAEGTQAEPEKKKVFDLSITQIAGGALAAMTAAALGSTLGVAGTIVGAALASIVAGVAGSLYTASLRTGRERVRTVFRPGGSTAASAPPAPVEAATTVIPRTSQGTAGEPATPYWEPLGADAGSAAATTKSRLAFPWKRAVAVALAVFALAAVLITGYERVSGQTLSGGNGTTVSQVGRDTGSGGGAGDTTPSSSTSPSSTPSASDTPSASTSPGVGTEPSATESAPTPAPSASESSSTPTESSSATPSAGESGAAAEGEAGTG